MTDPTPIPRDRFLVSTAKERLNIDYIHAYLTESYWAKGRTLQTVRTSIENSLCFGLYDEGQQIGFARVVTDKATFSYMADVFIDPDYQGQKLGTWLVDCILEHPEVKAAGRMMLGTEDAHQLYERVGFHAPKRPDRWMEKHF